MENESASSIHVSKDFPVSKDKLYKAWTEEEQLKKWWKPMGKQIVKVENNIQPGGSVAYHFEEDLQVHGEYEVAEAGRRLRYSWIWELPEESLHRGSYVLTVQFLEEGEGSRLDVTQENVASEHSIKPHETGWEEALTALQRHLAGDNVS